MKRRRQPLKPRPKLKLTLPFFLPFFFTLLLLTVTVLLLRSPFLKLHQINCTLNQQSCTAAQLDFLNSHLGRSVLSLKPTQISQDLLARDPSLKQAELSLTFPTTLNARLSVDTAIYTLGLSDDLLLPASPADLAATPSSTTATPRVHPYAFFKDFHPTTTHTLTFTQSGSIITPTPTPTDLRLFSTTTPDSAQLIALAAYLSEIDQSGLTFVRGLLIARDLLILLPDNCLVVLSLSQDPFSTISSLQQIRSTATIETSGSIIDLRFDKPVISSY